MLRTSLTGWVIGAVCALTAALAVVIPVAGAHRSPAPRLDCGEPHVFKAERDVNPGARAPLTVGDSVMSYALPNLAGVGYDADAQACRRFAQGLRLLRQVKAAGRLPHLVVVALGTDGSVQGKQIRQALGIIGAHRVLGLVTPREVGGGAGFDADVMRRAAREHPKRIVLFEWARYSRGHPRWFQPDKTHLTARGAQEFAKLHRRAVRWATPGRFPRGAVYP